MSYRRDVTGINVYLKNKTLELLRIYAEKSNSGIQKIAEAAIEDYVWHATEKDLKESKRVSELFPNA